MRSSQQPVGIDPDARRGVHADRVGHRLATLPRHLRPGRARNRALGAAQREISPRDGLGDPVVVDQRRAVEQLAIELDTIDGGEREPEHPGPVRAPGDRVGLLGAGPLGVARQARVRRLEGAHVDVAGAGGQPPQRQLGAPDQVLRLTLGDLGEQPPALAPAQATAAAPRPGEPAKALGIWIHSD